MSNTKRTITIDTANVQGLSGRGKNKNKTSNQTTTLKQKIKPNQFIRPSTLKKQLLARIKNHQQKKNSSTVAASKSQPQSQSRPSQAVPPVSENKESKGTTAVPALSVSNSNDAFTESLEYLKSLAANTREQRHQKQKNKTHKNHKVGSSPASTPVMVSPAPAFPQMPAQAQIMPTPAFPQMPPQAQVMPAPAFPQMPAQTQMPAPAFPQTPAPAPQVFLNTFPDSMVSESFQPHYSGLPDVSQSQEVHLNQEPQWGCLKRGNKPTFRTFHNKTCKLNALIHTPEMQTNTSVSVSGESGESSGESGDSEELGELGESGESGELETKSSDAVARSEVLYGSRQQRLDEYRNEQIKTDKKNIEPALKIKQTKQRVVTKRYKLGKYTNKNGPVIGVLIKNVQTQRNIEKKRNEMRHIPLDTIISRLYKKRLLKVGSTAPPDVLREMYESAVMAGDIENEGNDIALHNFLAGAEGSDESTASSSQSHS